MCNEVQDFDKNFDSTGNSSQPSSRQWESTVFYFLYFSAKRVHYFYMVVKFVILVTFIALLYMSEVSQTLYIHTIVL